MKLPQLSLRELFLLVVIAGMGCGWWVDHWQSVKLETYAPSPGSEIIQVLHNP